MTRYDKSTIDGTLAARFINSVQEAGNKFCYYLIAKEDSQLSDGIISEATERINRAFFSKDGRNDFTDRENDLEKVNFAQAQKIDLLRPSIVNVFGRGFVPSTEDVERMAFALGDLYAGIPPEIWVTFFRTMKVETNRDSSNDGDAFAKIVDWAKQCQPQGSYLVDTVMLDQQSGHDLVCIVAWDGHC